MAVFFPDEIKTTAQDAKVADAEFIKDSSLNNVSQKTLNKNIPFKTLPLTQMLTSKPSSINTGTVYTGGGTNVNGVVGYKYNDGGAGTLVGFVFSANDKYYAKWDVTGYPSPEAYANSEYNLFLVNGTINRIVAGELSPLVSGGGSSGGSGLPDGVTISKDAANNDYVFGNGAKLGENTRIGTNVSIQCDSIGNVKLGDNIDIKGSVQIGTNSSFADGATITSDGEIAVGTDQNRKVLLGSGITVLNEKKSPATLIVGTKSISSGPNESNLKVGIELGTDSVDKAKLVLGSKGAKVCDFSDNLLYELGGGSGSGGNVESEGGDYLHLNMGTLSYKDSLGTTYFNIHFEDGGQKVFNERCLDFGTDHISVKSSNDDDFSFYVDVDSKNVKLTAGTTAATVDFIGNVHIGTSLYKAPQGTDKEYSVIVFDQSNSRIVFKCIDNFTNVKYAVLPLRDSLEDYSVAMISDDTIEV